MKRVLAIVIALLCINALCAIVAFAAEEYEVGDANLDGSVNVKDATEIQKYIASLTEFSELQLEVADIDMSTYVSVSDATYIQKLVAGLVQKPQLPAKPTQPTETIPATTQPQPATVPDDDTPIELPFIPAF